MHNKEILKCELAQKYICRIQNFTKRVADYTILQKKKFVIFQSTLQNYLLKYVKRYSLD